jgi:hypothetical protein
VKLRGNPTFQSNILPPSSDCRVNQVNRKAAEADVRLFSPEDAGFIALRHILLSPNCVALCNSKYCMFEETN